MKIQTTRGRLMASTMICGAMAAFAVASPAFAQDGTETEVESIVVTGSRIARQDYVANSPVSTVTSEIIESSGDLNTEEILNSLPQVVPGLTAASNNPSNGTATVDLRGIGVTRTLVLVNGRRMNPADKTNVVDLNTIPTRLIERVEVVTGGASAVYGSDALAGVVNFVLKDDFEGIELSTQYGISEQSDGEQFNLSLIAGTNFAEGRGNVTGFVSYYDRDGILGADRDWAFIENSGGSGTGVTGSANNIALNCFGAFDPITRLPNATPCGTSDLPTDDEPNPFGTYKRGFDPDGTVRAFNNEFDLTLPSDRYNFAPVNYILSPAERFNMALIGHYEIVPNTEAFFEAFFTDSRNAAQLAPTPATPVQVPADNPFISDSLRTLLNTRPNPDAPVFVDRRMLEVGPRVESRNSDMYQVNVGLRSDLGNDWRSEIYYGFGRTEFNTGVRNDVSRSRMQAALTAEDADTCSDASLAIFPTCVPINLFGAGNISEEAAAFVRLNFDDESIFERHIVSASASGPLFALPAGSLDVAVGAEYREDSLIYTPDAAKAAGDIYGFNAELPVQGDYSVGELYAEALVPLLAEMPGVDYLGLELGVRWSDYSSVGSVLSYKAGVEYKPFEDLRFRAMYQRASRAPNVFELFQAGDQGFPPVLDPCTTVNPGTGAARTLTPEVRAFCTQTMGFDPVTNNFVAQNTQTESFFYGNPNLIEETSDTVTAGVVWRPSFVPGFNVTLDYYDIKVEDYVGTLAGGVSGIIGNCFDAADLNDPACFDEGIGLPLIFRDEASNLKARAPLANVSELQTKGIDLTVNYGWDVPWAGGMMGERLDLNLIVTRLDSYELDGIEYAGTVGAYNISAALPEWKAAINVGYDIGPVRLSYNGTYIGEMDNQGNIPDFEDGGYVGTDAYWLHDLSAKVEVTDHVEFFGGVKNLADEDPPVFDNAPDGNTDPNSFDIIGRYWFVGATLRY